MAGLAKGTRVRLTRDVVAHVAVEGGQVARTAGDQGTVVDAVGSCVWVEFDGLGTKVRRCEQTPGHVTRQRMARFDAFWNGVPLQEVEMGRDLVDPRA